MRHLLEAQAKVRCYVSKGPGPRETYPPAKAKYLWACFLGALCLELALSELQYACSVWNTQSSKLCWRRTCCVACYVVRGRAGASQRRHCCERARPLHVRAAALLTVGGFVRLQ